MKNPDFAQWSHEKMPRTVTEITEVLSRVANPFPAEHAVEMLKLFWDNSMEKFPFSDFVPIRLTTILEHSIRRKVADAVNHGQPFSSKGLQIISKMSGKHVAEALVAIDQDKLTIGDLVSHGLPLGSITDIIASLATIFGEDFKRDLASAHTLWIEDEGKEEPPIIQDIQSTLGTLSRMLQCRHILVHELPASPPYDLAEIDDFFEHTRQFVTALHWLLTGKKFGRVGRSTLAMKQHAFSHLERAQAELDELRGGDNSKFISPRSEEEELEFHWDRFADLFSRRRAGYFKKGHTGTMSPILFAIAKMELTKWRTEALRAVMASDNW